MNLDEISIPRIPCLTIENGMRYWNSKASSYGRVREDFGANLMQINGDILDIGCSEGETTREIADIYPDSRVIGIDRSSERIEIARKNCLGCEFLVADAYDLPFERNSFEGVFCMNNLWFLMSKNRTRVPDEVFLKIWDLIQQGGYFFFSGSYHGLVLRKSETPEIVRYKRAGRIAAPQVGTLLEVLSPKSGLEL
jgi:SAM-dependent methyltransferase